MKRLCTIALPWLLLSSVEFSHLHAQGTAFAYQGRLNDGGVPANGTYLLRFAVFDGATGGNQRGPALTNAAAVVSNGLFSVMVDFGFGVFDGGGRWLEIGVATNAGVGFTLLSPRQPMLSTPYAFWAANASQAVTVSGTVPASGLNGVYSNPVNFNNPANSLTGNGTGLSNVNAATLNGLNSANFWSINGNVGTNWTFLGTVNNHPLEFRVWNSRVMRIEDNGDAPNLIAGHRGNNVSNGLLGVTIAGGGSRDFPNLALSDYAAVLGGSGNSARGRNSVAMGFNATAGGNYSVAAGADAQASGLASIAMGSSSRARGQDAVAVGSQNEANGTAALALGSGTVASGAVSTAMGGGTVASGDFSTALGFVTQAYGAYSTALGRGSIAEGENSFAAGYRARARHHSTFVWSDDVWGNEFASTESYQFLIRAYNGVGIGTSRPQGDLHIYSDKNPTVVRVQSTGTPGFGRFEFVSNPQGDANEWRPAYIQSTDAGDFTGGLSFVVNGTGAASKFAEVEAMRIQNGRVGIGTANPQSTLHVNGTATISGQYLNVSGGGNEQAYIGGDGVGGDVEIGSRNAGILNVGFWNSSANVHMNVYAKTFISTSDRQAKHDFVPADTAAILEKVVALPITEWSFKGETSIRHLGPVAQDFKEAFGVGNSDKSIATVDADGVALAAIQGLNQRLTEELRRRDAENAILKQRLEKLEVLLNKFTQ